MIFIQPSVLCRRTLVCQEPQNNLLILFHYGKMNNNNLIFILPPWMNPQFYFRTNHWEWMEPIIFNPLNEVLLLGTLKEGQRQGECQHLYACEQKTSYMKIYVWGEGDNWTLPIIWRDIFVLQMFHIMWVYKKNNNYYSNYINPHGL